MAPILLAKARRAMAASAPAPRMLPAATMARYYQQFLRYSPEVMRAAQAQGVHRLCPEMAPRMCTVPPPRGHLLKWMDPLVPPETKTEGSIGGDVRVFAGQADPDGAALDQLVAMIDPAEVMCVATCVSMPSGQRLWRTTWSPAPASL